MAFLPGKFARFRASGVAFSGPFRWNVGFRRERLDLTNFESAVGASGANVHSEGTTGVLDTTFSVEVYLSDTNANVFFPDAAFYCDLLYRKAVQLGYVNVLADVLDFQGNTSVRDKAAGTVQMQANGIVPLAA